ncbi:MAG: FAD-dependent oxidoreductase, partial [SAR324 cluster bacterium]|nr:FAD-dependent oxidoreductase [SAR324 cluster bacterium]
VLEREISHIKANGVDIICGKKVGTELPWSELATFAAVYISIGVHQNRRLGIPSEDAGGVYSGLGFLKSVASGKTPALGEQVIVIGGGNSAIDSARCALRKGSRVMMFYQRSRQEMPAFSEEVSEALKEGVNINFLTQPVKILTDNNRVSGIQLRSTKLGSPDTSGRRRPEPIPNSEFNIKADSIITAIGETSDLSWLPPEIHRENGRIAVNLFGQTSQKNIFAGGDAALPEHNVATAIGSGKVAACAIDAFLRDLDLESVKSLITIGDGGTISVSRYLQQGDAHKKQPPSGKPVTFEDLNTNYFKKSARQKIKTLDIRQRLGSFDEVNCGLNAESALHEAKRCFHCGVCNHCDNCYIFCPDIAVLKDIAGNYQINLDYCKGCGICINECPRNAMIMEAEQ